MAEKLSELQERLFQLERRIRPLEWDCSRNQINEFKKIQLVKLRTEYELLQKEVQGLNVPESVPEVSIEM